MVCQNSWRLFSFVKSMLVLGMFAVTGSNPHDVAAADSTFDSIMDAEFHASKAHDIIGAQHIYAAGFDGSSTRIAIADTGMAPWWISGADMPFHRVAQKYDFYAPTPDAASYHVMEFVHGHAVATIAAGARNGIGAQGIAYNATLYDYKISSPFRGLAPQTPQRVADMMAQARRDRIDVLSGAWGWWSRYDISVWDDNWMRGAMRPYVDEIRQMNAGADGYRGTALVVAAGNEGMPNPSNLLAMTPYWFPDVQSKMLAVVALDVAEWVPGTPYTDPKLAHYSSHCGIAKDWCLAAPAHGVQLWWPTNQLVAVGGTSAATAVTTGAIALLMDAFPEIDAEQAIAIVLESASDIGAVGVDEMFGHGLLNLEAAMQPLGAPVVTINGVSTRLTGTFLETSNLLGAGFGASLSDASYVFQDKYGRYFTATIDGVLVGNQSGFADDLATQVNPNPAASFAMIGETRFGFSAAGGFAYMGADEGISMHFTVGRKGDRAVLSQGVLPFDHIRDDAVTAVMRVGTRSQGHLGDGVSLGITIDDNVPTAFAAYQAHLTDSVSIETGVMAEHNRLHGADGGGAFAWRGQTLTGWAGATANWQLSNHMWAGADAMVGYLDYRGTDDVLVSGLKGALVKGTVSFTMDDSLTRGDRVQISLSLPTTMLEGHVRLRLPVRGGMVNALKSFDNDPAYEVKAVWSLRF